MSSDLQGRSVLITGCSSGIGLAVAKHLLSAGYKVIASARRDADVQKLREMGFDALRIDLSDPEGLAGCVEQALAMAGGRFYGVFHNAGYGQAGALEDLPPQALADQFQVNVFGAHAINVMLLKGMREAGEGRVVFNSSVLGFLAMSYRGAYNASKFAIEGMADTLRLELAGSGVHVSVIQPGPLNTRFRANSLKAMLSHIDPTQGVHARAYGRVIERLSSPEPVSRWALDAHACNTAVLHALQSASPKHRYRITVATKAAAVLKRLLPSVLLDRIAARGL